MSSFTRISCAAPAGSSRTTMLIEEDDDEHLDDTTTVPEPVVASTPVGPDVTAVATDPDECAAVDWPEPSFEGGSPPAETAGDHDYVKHSHTFDKLRPSFYVCDDKSVEELRNSDFGNSSPDGWRSPWAKDAEAEGLRFHCRKPGAPPAKTLEEDISSCTMALTFPYEGMPQCEVAERLDTKSGGPGYISLDIDAKVLEQHIWADLRIKHPLLRAVDQHQYHVVPLRGDIVWAQNTSGFTFNAEWHTSDLHPDRAGSTVALHHPTMISSYGQANCLIPAHFSDINTMPAGMRSLIPSGRFRASEFSSPEAARWLSVDMNKELSDVRQYLIPSAAPSTGVESVGAKLRREKYPGHLAIDVPVDCRQPETMAQFVCLTHGWELRHATRTCGTGSMKIVKHTKKTADGDAVDGEQFIVSLAAFEAAMRHLCLTYHPSKYAISLTGRNEVRLYPINKSAASQLYRSRAPVSITVMMEWIFTVHPGAQSPSEQSQALVAAALGDGTQAKRALYEAAMRSAENMESDSGSEEEDGRGQRRLRPDDEEPSGGPWSFSRAQAERQRVAGARVHGETESQFELRQEKGLPGLAPMRDGESREEFDSRWKTWMRTEGRVDRAESGARATVPRPGWGSASAHRLF